MTEERWRLALEDESQRFAEYYQWLEKNMSEVFFKEVPLEHVMLIAHNLMGLHLQDYFSPIHLKHIAIVLSLDSVDADINVLKRYRRYGIKHYRHYTSLKPLPHGGNTRLRVTTLYFTEAVETTGVPLPVDEIHELKEHLHDRNPDLLEEDFDKLLSSVNSRFLTSLPLDRLAIAMDMFFRAKTRDHCQYEVRYNDDWQKQNIPSMQIMLAWRNTPKYDFLYRLAKLVHRHKLVMRRVNATYIDPYGRQSILIMAIGLDGEEDQAAWEAADIPDFLRELVTLKYFGGFPNIMDTFVDTGLLRGNLANVLKAAVYWIHQVLVHVDAHMYTLDSVTEALIRHPELTVKICQAFEAKFGPDIHNIEEADAICEELLELIERLDTGHEVNDTRRKNVLKQGVNFVTYTLKTNFYRNNKTALSFRVDPAYLNDVPFNRRELFPELPYGVFFVKGMHYIGYQIRFRDLSRGGLRTVYPESHEEMLVEVNNVFRECYNLAYTQQKKNKDIPEGGAKAVIFLKPYERLQIESEILRHELKTGGFNEDETDGKIKKFYKEQREEYLYQTQRSFVSSLLTIVNCDDDGRLRVKHVVDYYHRPEYLYLGPDERMHSSMIQWIAAISKYRDYKPGVSFISSKPRIGINHKEYGVTSLGVNVYMREVLLFMGINPDTEPFTLKISGGPDGDVAGNQIFNLYRDYKETAKIIALTDVSGTINDPEGLDLNALVELFHAERPISYYPPAKLSEGGFLLDRRTKRSESAYVQQTLLWRKNKGEVVQEWLGSSEVARLFHTNVHQAKVDIFIPAGGRPRALSTSNLREFLDPSGEPTARAIVEGANLYLTPDARRALEDLGTIIIKDSSANKCGVICSSFEVLCGLVLTEEELLEHKDTLVEQILETLKARAYDEAQIMLTTHKETGEYLTDLSNTVSEQINTYTDQLLAYFEGIDLPKDPSSAYMRAYLCYCLPFLRKNYADRLIAQVPEGHKKAIIACHIASRLVYERGMSWSPSIVEILPVIKEDRTICGDQ